MKKHFVLACLWAATLIFISTGSLNAQEIVFNGDFETKAYSPMWTLTGGNAHTTVAYYQTVVGEYSYCMRRMPGLPNDNGGIEQQVHLMEGDSYLFSVDIAVTESG